MGCARERTKHGSKVTCGLPQGAHRHDHATAKAHCPWHSAKKQVQYLILVALASASVQHTHASLTLSLAFLASSLLRWHWLHKDWHALPGYDDAVRWRAAGKGRQNAVGKWGRIGALHAHSACLVALWLSSPCAKPYCHKMISIPQGPGYAPC
jgi:hypothetical protein